MSRSDATLMSSTSIRLAVSDDEQSMAKIEIESRSQLAAYGVALDRFNADGFVEDRSWDVALVAENSHGIVGFVRATADGEDLIIDQLSVLPDWGRRGIGHQLLIQLLNEAKKSRFRRILGTTFAEVPFNAAWYRRLGATVVDDHELAKRRAIEQGVGLDALGRRVVVSFTIPY